MQRMWPVRLLLAAFSGFTLALAFPSYDLPFFAWFSVAGLMLVSIGVGWSRAGLCGFFHGMAFYIASLPWIYTVMRVHGGVPHLPAAGILLLLAAVFSLYSAVFAAAVAWRAKSSLARACLAAPFLWVALEFARTYLIFGGFPWNLLGYAASGNLGLLQVVSLTGIYGLSFIVAGYNALLAWLVLAPAAGRLRYLIVWLGSSTALIGVMAFGPRFVPGSPGKSANATQEPIARLVQTDFPQSPSYPADWMERHAAELNDLEELSLSGEHDKLGVIIWPEVPAPFSFLDAGFTARVERIARTSQRSFLVGVVDWKPGAHGGLAPP